MEKQKMQVYSVADITFMQPVDDDDQNLPGSIMGLLVKDSKAQRSVFFELDDLTMDYLASKAVQHILYKRDEDPYYNDENLDHVLGILKQELAMFLPPDITQELSSTIWARILLEGPSLDQDKDKEG